MMVVMMVMLRLVRGIYIKRHQIVNSHACVFHVCIFLTTLPNNFNVDEASS